jgi:hypothetical protein
VADLIVCRRGHELPAGAICPYCGGSPPECEGWVEPPPAEPEAAPASGQPDVLLVVADVRVGLADGETVLLGREGDGRLNAALRRFDNVSRRHAVLTVQGRSAEIQDVGSLNGTYLTAPDAAGAAGEMRRLGPNEPETVALPAIVRLARNCYLRLETGGE